MIDEKELLMFINRQIKANRDYLKLVEKRMGKGWIEENHEKEYFQGANTALYELAFYMGLVDIESSHLIEDIE